MTLRILFSEGSSLTAREFLSVLGPAGHHIEALDPNPACVCRFSRWMRRLHPTPPSGADPLAYLAAVKAAMAGGRFDVLLPTHEQAWLFAAGRRLLASGAPVAVASAEAFLRVAGKIGCARLLDELSLPQPEWGTVASADELRHWEAPFYLKAPFSTAGTGVRRVSHRQEAEAALRSLRAAGYRGPLMVQAAVEGAYAQVQALFDMGRMVAAHTSVQTAVGIGPSAAGRVSVDHRFARRELAQLGERLKWHGGLTLDYLFGAWGHAYIECNPRSVEPANAVASGVDIPGLQLRLSMGEHPASVPAGRAAVRTHGALAVLMGTAHYGGTRRAVVSEALRLALGRGPYRRSRESLTPVTADMPSLIPLALAGGCAMLQPRAVAKLAGAAVTAYSVTPEAVAAVSSSAIGPP